MFIKRMMQNKNTTITEVYAPKNMSVSDRSNGINR